MKYLSRRRFGHSLARSFDRIYCINLDDRPDRWQYAQDQFARFGLNRRITRFSAIDVRNDPGLRANEKLLRNNFSLLAMCGCMLSHRKIIETARDENLDNVLVFEDDIRFLEDNVGSIDRSLNQLGQLDWDVFYLGATYLFRLEPLGDHLVRVPNGAYATHAIAYNSCVFDRILETLPSTPEGYLESDRFEVNALDKWLQAGPFDRQRFFGTNPIMVVQGLQESDIAHNQADGIEQTQLDLFKKNLGS